MTEPTNVWFPVARIYTEHDLLGIEINWDKLPWTTELRTDTNEYATITETQFEDIVPGKHWLAQRLAGITIDDPTISEQDAVKIGALLLRNGEVSDAMFSRILLLPSRKASLVVAGILGEDKTPVNTAKTFTHHGLSLVRLVQAILIQHMHNMVRLSSFKEDDIELYQLEIPDLYSNHNWKRQGDFALSRITSIEMLCSVSKTWVSTYT